MDASNLKRYCASDKVWPAPDLNIHHLNIPGLQCLPFCNIALGLEAELPHTP